MPFVAGLGRVDAAVHAGEEVQGEAHECLDKQQDVRDQAQDGVRRLKVRPGMGEFVHLDNNEGGDESVHGKAVDRGVDESAATLLCRSVGRLEDEDGFGDAEEAGGVEEGVCREENEGADEDVGPDGSHQQEDASLCEDRGAWMGVRGVIITVRTLRELTYGQILVERMSLLLRSITGASQERLILSDVLFRRDNRLVGDTGSRSHGWRSWKGKS